MNAADHPTPISDLLRRTIRAAVEAGRTNYKALERETGVTRARQKKGDASCAKKLGKGGMDVSNITETFRRNPTGKQSRPAEPGQQPEASLASLGATHGAKRRQPVSKPCHSAPKLPLARSLRRDACGGRAGAP